jgi:hypothetical protein
MSRRLTKLWNLRASRSLDSVSPLGSATANRSPGTWGVVVYQGRTVVVRQIAVAEAERN